jgi:MFS transporter, DHA1 family, multidrug resistance protein
MLEQQEGDTGALSSLMGCTAMPMGSRGKQLISIQWGNKIIALGILTLIIAVVSLFAWPFVIKHITR